MFDDWSFKKLWCNHGLFPANISSKGYFIEPTIIQSLDPLDKIMQEEIFGPLLVVYVYNDNHVEETLRLVKNNQYALTGSVFAQDQ